MQRILVEKQPLLSKSTSLYESCLLHGLPYVTRYMLLAGAIYHPHAVDVVAFRQAGWERMSYLAMAALLTFEYCELSLCIDIVWIFSNLCSVLQFGNEVRNMNVSARPASKLTSLFRLLGRIFLGEISDELCS